MCCESRFSRNELFLVVALCGVTFTTGLTASLQAPFYPEEAEKKGASATEYGMVFGVFELVAFIVSPIYGKYMSRLGASLVLKSGIIVAGVSTILFGLLDLVTGHWGFIGLSFLVRIIESIGTAAVVTASLSIVVLVFSESFARVFAMLEILHGMGYMVGPTVGGYLFEVGGFLCPFLVVGVVVLVNGVFVCATLPALDDSEGRLKPKVPLSSVLKIVPVSLAAACMMVEAMSVGFLAATLEPHLRQFQLSPTLMGAMFIISGAVYTCVAPLVGILCDKEYNPKHMIMFGSLLVIGGFCLIGPLPFTPFETSLWMVGPGLVLDGLGMSFIFVPAFVDAILSSVKYGLSYDITTYSMVSGIYASAFALGAFIGPTVGGMLLDAVGFREASIFVLVIHLLMFVAMTSFVCLEKRYEQKNIKWPSNCDTEAILVHKNAAEPETIALMVARPRGQSYTSPTTGYNTFTQHNSLIYTPSG